LLAKSDLGYVCPICLRVFKETDSLSKEHVPPSSLGGKVLCLTCGDCNSEAGYRVDTHAHRERLSRSFLSRDAQSRRAKLDVRGTAVNIELKRDETGTRIHIPKGQNDPEVVKRFPWHMSDLIECGGEFRLQDTVSYSKRKADISYLKSAYLAAFAKLGYAYILRPALNRVRKQIQNPSEICLEVVRLYASDIDAVPKAFLLVQEPVRCLGAKIDNSVLCLPLIDGDDTFYEELTALRSQGEPKTWRGTAKIEWPRRFELALDFASESEMQTQSGS